MLSLKNCRINLPRNLNAKMETRGRIFFFVFEHRDFSQLNKHYSKIEPIKLERNVSRSLRYRENSLRQSKKKKKKRKALLTQLDRLNIFVYHNFFDRREKL